MDAAAFNRQGTLAYGQSLVGATEGLKNNLSMKVDNAGVTKNLCLCKSMLILDIARNEWRTIEEVYKEQEREQCEVMVLAYDENSGEFVKTSTNAITYNGVKPIFEITTHSGGKFRATHNHRFLTQDGYKRLDELTTDDYLTGVNNHTIELEEGQKVCEKCGEVFETSFAKTKYCMECRTITCETCGKIFTVKSNEVGRTRFCSRDCRNGASVNYASKVCENCGNEYTPTNPKQKWCKDCLVHTCEYCGKVFPIAKKTLKSSKRFCSLECKHKYRSENYVGENGCNYRNGNYLVDVDLICDFCGEEFTVKQVKIGDRENHFCSDDCRLGFLKRNMFQATCYTCGKELDVPNRFKDTTDWFYCSSECKHGSGTSRGRVIEHRVGGRGAEANKWRLSVLKRDGCSCRICKSSKNLHVHHIVPWGEDEAKRYDLDNGIVYCRSCHKKIHRKNREFESFQDKVVSIEYVGEERTYDLSVPETHNFVVKGSLYTPGCVTHNSIMEQEYAATLGKTIGQLTEAEKTHSHYVGIMKEAAYFAGDMAQVTSTLGGMTAKLAQQHKKFYIDVGRALKPEFIKIIGGMSKGFEKLGKFILDNSDYFQGLLRGINDVGKSILSLIGGVGLLSKAFDLLTFGSLFVVRKIFMDFPQYLPLTIALFVVMSKTLKNTSLSARNFATTISDMFTKRATGGTLKEQQMLLQRYSKSLVDLKIKQEKYYDILRRDRNLSAKRIEKIKKNIVATRGFIRGTEEAIVAQRRLVRVASRLSKAYGVLASAVAFAGQMIAALAIAWAIGKILEYFDKKANAAKYAIQALAEASSKAMQELKDLGEQVGKLESQTESLAVIVSDPVLKNNFPLVFKKAREELELLNKALEDSHRMYAKLSRETVTEVGEAFVESFSIFMNKFQGVLAWGGNDAFGLNKRVADFVSLMGRYEEAAKLGYGSSVEYMKQIRVQYDMLKKEIIGFAEHPSENTKHWKSLFEKVNVVYGQYLDAMEEDISLSIVQKDLLEKKVKKINDFSKKYVDFVETVAVALEKEQRIYDSFDIFYAKRMQEFNKLVRDLQESFGKIFEEEFLSGFMKKALAGDVTGNLDELEQGLTTQYKKSLINIIRKINEVSAGAPSLSFPINIHKSMYGFQIPLSLDTSIEEMRTLLAGYPELVRELQAKADVDLFGFGRLEKKELDQIEVYLSSLEATDMIHDRLALSVKKWRAEEETLNNKLKLTNALRAQALIKARDMLKITAEASHAELYAVTKIGRGFERRLAIVDKTAQRELVIAAQRRDVEMEYIWETYAAKLVYAKMGTNEYFFLQKELHQKLAAEDQKYENTRTKMLRDAISARLSAEQGYNSQVLVMAQQRVSNEKSIAEELMTFYKERLYTRGGIGGTQVLDPTNLRAYYDQLSVVIRKEKELEDLKISQMEIERDLQVIQLMNLKDLAWAAGDSVAKYTLLIAKMKLLNFEVYRSKDGFVEFAGVAVKLKDLKTHVFDVYSSLEAWRSTPLMQQEQTIAALASLDSMVGKTTEQIRAMVEAALELESINPVLDQLKKVFEALGREALDYMMTAFVTGRYDLVEKIANANRQIKSDTLDRIASEKAAYLEGNLTAEQYYARVRAIKAEETRISAAMEKKMTLEHKAQQAQQLADTLGRLAVETTWKLALATIEGIKNRDPISVAQAAGYAALIGGLTAAAGAQARIAHNLRMRAGAIDTTFDESVLDRIDTMTSGSSMSRRVGGTIRAEELTINISPTVVFHGENIVIGPDGLVEAGESLGQMTVGAVQDSIETGEIDLGLARG